MRKFATWFFAVALCGSTEAMAARITHDDAIAIALREAGCSKPEECDVRGGLTEGGWRFVVWFVTGRNADGSPQFTPGGWMGITLNEQGEVVDRMPGA